MESTQRTECECCEDDGYIIVRLPPGHDRWRPNLTTVYSKECERCKDQKANE